MSLKDQVALATNPVAIRRPAFQTINLIQSMAHRTSPGDSLIGVAAAVIAICETNNIPAPDVFRKAERMLNDASKHTALIDALRDYARHEMRNP